MAEVSIIVPATNAGRTIVSALDSVWAQTFRDFEVIIADHGSSDDTEELAAGSPCRPLYLRVDARAGRAAACNAALERSSGLFVAFLDPAGVWMPRKLARQIDYLRRYPATGLLHAASIVSQTPMETLLATSDQFPLEPDADPPARAVGAIFHQLIDVSITTAMIGAQALAEVGTFNAQLSADVADWDLCLRLASRRPVGYLPTPLAVRRPEPAPRDVERTISDRRHVIDRRTPALTEACERHPGQGDACVREGLYRFHADAGRARFRSGRMREARQSWGAALRLRPASLSMLTCYAASLLAPRGISTPRIRRVRAALARGRNRPVSLVRDTTIRRTRHAVVEFLHTADDALTCAARSDVRILFEAASPLSLAVFQPVLERLRRDPRLEFWFLTSDGAWDAERIFGRAGISGHVLTPQRVRRMKFDAYINTDFWNTTWLNRRVRRIHLFHGVAGKYGLDAPVRIGGVVASFDRLLFPNRDRLDRYARAGLIDGESAQAALIGYPKADCLVDGSLDRLAIARELGLAPSTPTVLYAPTWSPHSSLSAMGPAIIASLARMDVNVIVKLHDRSFEPSARGSGGVDWRLQLDTLCRHWPVHLAEGADVSPYLAVADAVVTDHSSVGFEFMLLDRPLVVVDCPVLLEKARVSPDKVQLLRGAADVVSEAEQVAGAVRRALTDPTRLNRARRDVAARLFFKPGTATDRAVACIYDVLELPMPEEARCG